MDPTAYGYIICQSQNIESLANSDGKGPSLFKTDSAQLIGVILLFLSNTTMQPKTEMKFNKQVFSQLESIARKSRTFKTIGGLASGMFDIVLQTVPSSFFPQTGYRGNLI